MNVCDDLNRQIVMIKIIFNATPDHLCQCALRTINQILIWDEYLGASQQGPTHGHDGQHLDNKEMIYNKDFLELTCSTLRTSSSQTVRRMRTARTDPLRKAMLRANTVAMGDTNMSM